MVARDSKASLSSVFDALDMDNDGLLSFEEMFLGAEVADGEGVPPADALPEAADAEPEPQPEPEPESHRPKATKSQKLRNRRP